MYERREAPIDTDMGRRSAWDRLAEALGIKTEINWTSVAKRRQMQQGGTMDRRDRQGPMPYFRPQAMQQRQQQARASAMAGQGQSAMAQIPFGTDRPGQRNPLFAPPRSRSPLATPPNSPQALQGGDEGEEEGAEY